MKLHPSRCWRAFAFAFSAAALAALPARATLVAQDDFDTYVPGVIDGLNGGNNGTSSALGWSGAWSGVSGATVSLESIRYPHPTNANEYLALGQSLKIAATTNNVVTRTLPSSGGADRYVSFYFEIKNASAGNSPVSGNMFAGWQALDSAGSSTNYTAGLLGVNGKAGARVGDSTVAGGNSQYLDDILFYNKGYFVVVRYFGWSGGRYRQCQIWLDPVSQSSTSKTATTTTSGVGSAGFDGLRLRTLNLDANTYYLFDNLRVGTAWSDVTGTPAAVSYTVNTSLGWAPYQLAAPVSGSDLRALGIASGGPLDFSTLNGTTAAGSSGFIKKPTNNQFVFTGAQSVPVRFAGVNVCEAAALLDTTQAAQLAEDLKRSGYNAVRLHNFDRLITEAYSSAPAGTPKFQIKSAELRKVDNLFRALKARGIYISIDLYSLRSFSQAEVDDMVGAGNITSGFGVEDFKALLPINANARASWEKYARDILTYVNPDRGSAPTRWIDDPALISICMVNEDNLYSQWANNGLHPYIKQLYDTEYNNTQAIYATPNDTPDERFSRFLFAKHLKSDNDNRAFLQSLNVKALLTGTNYGGPDQPLVYQRSTYDYVDEHIYYNHPYYTGSTGWTPYTSNQLGSLVVNNAILPRTVMPSRIFDKPFTVSEWNISRPNRYRGEAAVLMPALSSLQDWNGLFTFQYAHEVTTALDSKFHNAFNLTSDPINLITSRLTALLFRRGDISPAPVTNRIAWAIRPNEVYETPGTDYVKSVSSFFGNVGFVTQIGMLAGSYSEVLAKPNIHAAVSGTSPAETTMPAGAYACDQTIAAKLTNTGGVNKLTPGTLSTSASTSPMTVNSGSVTSYSSRPQIKIESNAGIASVVAARCELFALGADKSTTGVQVTSVANKATPASVCVISVDGTAPLSTSSRILIAHLTDSLPQGAQFSNGSRTSYTSWGAGPHLVARGTTTLTIKLAAGTWTAHVIDHTGRKVGRTITMQSVGTNTYKLDLSTVTTDGTQLLYELVRT